MHYAYEYNIQIIAQNDVVMLLKDDMWVKKCMAEGVILRNTPKSTWKNVVEADTRRMIKCENALVCSKWRRMIGEGYREDYDECALTCLFLVVVHTAVLRKWLLLLHPTSETAQLRVNSFSMEHPQKL